LFLSRHIKGGKNVSRFNLDPKKFDYFFGKVAPPPISLKATDPKKYKKLKHNYDRSQQLKKIFESKGISNNAEGQQKLLDIFERGTNSPKIAEHVGDYGTTVTRAVVKDDVKLEIKYFYPKGDMDVTPNVVTVIPKVLKSTK